MAVFGAHRSHQGLIATYDGRNNLGWQKRIGSRGRQWDVRQHVRDMDIPSHNVCNYGMLPHIHLYGMSFL